MILAIHLLQDVNVLKYKLTKKIPIAKYFVMKKIISLFLKDDHWNRHKRDLCDKRSMRHLSILLYYLYMRIDHLVFYNFNNNYKFNIVV